MKTVVFDREHLRNMLRDFTLLGGIRISFWDIAGTKRIYSADQEDSAFCTRVKSVRQLHSACSACDRVLLEKAMAQKSAVRVRCHAGLEECALPVIVEGELMGFFMIGQTRYESATDPCPADRWQEQFGLDAQTTKTLYAQLPHISRAAQAAAERMLDALAVSACTKGYIRTARLTLLGTFETYVDKHLAEPLTLERMCRVLGVSRSTLCACLRQQLHTTFVAYVNRKRVALALELMRSGLPLPQVSSAAGFTSVSYFSRIFRKMMGVCPSRFHKDHLVAQTDTAPLQTPPCPE